MRDKLALALADFFLVLAALVVALGLRVDFQWDDMVRYLDHQAWLFPSVATVSVVMFYLFGLYEKVWRYAGTHELIAVVTSMTVCVIPFQILVLVGRGVLYPRTGLALFWMVAIFFCGGVRLLLRLASERLGRPRSGVRTLIAGANDAGETILRELSRGDGHYTVVGFVDEARARVKIRGVGVLGRFDDLPDLIESKEIRQVILAQLRPAQVHHVMELCRGKEVELRVVPAVEDVVAGHIQVSQLRELSIEDLLEREPVRHQPEKIAGLLAGRRVMITGAGGSIGSEIARQAVRFGPERLILVGRGENSLYEIGLELAASKPILGVCDVRNRTGMARLFEEHRPEIVFHAAAHKHVPMMEHNVAEAVSNNVFGTLGLMRLAQEYKVSRFILLSTDKAVNPTSIMGSSKRLAEMLLANQHQSGFAAVRFGNVLGSRGSVVPTFRKQIAQGGPVTVTDPEMTRFFMTIPEAVTLVMQAAAMARGGEIYLLDMGKPVKILDLARNLIRLSGYEPDQDIKIECVGRRPGEKTFEELVNPGEGTEPTQADKVLRIVSEPPGPEWPGARLKELEQAVEAGREEDCRRLLGELILPSIAGFATVSADHSQ